MKKLKNFIHQCRGKKIRKTRTQTPKMTPGHLQTPNHRMEILQIMTLSPELVGLNLEKSKGRIMDINGRVRITRENIQSMGKKRSCFRYSKNIPIIIIKIKKVIIMEGKNLKFNLFDRKGDRSTPGPQGARNIKSQHHHHDSKHH